MVEVPPGVLSFALASFTDPGIQFSNDSTIAGSTLTGPDIDDFEAFNVSGMHYQALVTVGYFWRFQVFRLSDRDRCVVPDQRMECTGLVRLKLQVAEQADASGSARGLGQPPLWLKFPRRRRSPC